MTRLALAAAGASLLALAATLGAAAVQDPPVTPDGGRPFEGAWSATGQRRTLATGGERPAAIVQVSGAVVLTLGEGLSRGFRGELIGFDDGQAVSLGRWVWTDERGDRLFGEVKGGPVRTGRRLAGAITGGTGRYAGITGEVWLTWQYVLDADEGTIQVRTTGLKGWYRPAGAKP